MELLTIIILLAIVTLLLFAIEALITPGFGVAGICGAVCAVVANILTFIRYGNAIGMAVLGAVVIGFLYWLSRSRAIERATLHSTISSTAATPAQLSIKAGDEGRAETRLALIGNAVIDGKTVEVKSADGFIDEGTPIVVTRVEDALILVRRKPGKNV